MIDETRSLSALENLAPSNLSLEENHVKQLPHTQRHMLQQDHCLDDIIGDPDLVYMWPQVVLQASSLEVATQHVAGFVRSYIQEYRKQHPFTDIEPLVLKSMVARVFVPGEKNFEEAFRTLMGYRKPEIYTAVLGLLAHGVEANETRYVDIEPYLVRRPDDSLIDHSAIGVLRFRVQKYLEATTAPRLPPGNPIFTSVRQVFENLSTRFYRHAMPPNLKRINWTCVS